MSRLGVDEVCCCSFCLVFSLLFIYTGTLPLSYKNLRSFTESWRQSTTTSKKSRHFSKTPHNTLNDNLKKLVRKKHNEKKTKSPLLKWWPSFCFTLSQSCNRSLRSSYPKRRGTNGAGLTI